MSHKDKPPGQRAAEAIREAKAHLADPSKSEYHQRLSAAIDRMQGGLDFWAQLAAVNDLVDITNESTGTIDVLDVEERDLEWRDIEGFRWRWRDGWQWWLEGKSVKWITSNRPKIMARGPFTPI